MSPLRLLVALLGLVLSHAAAHAEKRVALVVGIAGYAHTTPLTNPLNDARDVAAALKASGFTVIEALDADRRRFDGALRDFTDKLTGADVALFYYAGHGLQVGTQNFLVPVDAKLERERDLEFEAVKLEFVLRQMEIDREGKVTIALLDACRDNPLARNLSRSMGTRSASIGRGLAAPATGLGTFIAYATQPGNVALDGDGRNSPFTTALLKHMRTAGRSLPATMIEVRKDVVAATGGRQVPWDHSALTGEFQFVRGDTAASGTTAAAQPDVAALQARLAALEAERTRDQAAAKMGAATPAAPATAAATMPPVTPRPRPDDSASNFDETDSVRLAGAALADPFRAPNPAACRNACEASAGCVAFQHGRKVPVMGQCQLFSAIAARHEDPQWRSGVRRAGPAPRAAGPMSSVEAVRAALVAHGLSSSRTARGYQAFERVHATGDSIKNTETTSADACPVVCHNTPGCIAAVHEPRAGSAGGTCRMLRSVVSIADSEGATSFVRAP